MVRTAVGDRYVLEHMREHGYNLGGEQSGHIILSDYSTTGDGLVAALQVLAVVQAAAAGRSAKSATASSPLPQILKNVRFAERPARSAQDGVTAVIEAARERLGDAGGCVIRPSGTEPVIRVMGEGDDRDLVESVVDDVCDALSAPSGAARGGIARAVPRTWRRRTLRRQPGGASARNSPVIWLSWSRPSIRTRSALPSRCRSAARDVAGGEHHHRDVGAAGPLAQRVQEGEPVHHRHGEVEQDDARQAMRHLIERLLAVGGLARRSSRCAPARCAAARARRIVVDDQHVALGSRNRSMTCFSLSQSTGLVR